ncbi:MAG: precorrin-6A reductase [Lachnospiraceae bacterium]|nr:precorrin-6A reductase [Lachnospiraceae bacterium]
MKKLMLFAGTTEGRELAQYLEERKVNTKVFVATQYGEELLQSGKFIQVESGKLESSDMEKKIEVEKPEMVIDATHPFAQIVSENIKRACDTVGIKYIRLLRNFEERSYSNCIYVENTKEAIRYLNKVSGRVLITTGSKDLKELTAVNEFEKRLVVRILPDSDNLMACRKLGFQPQNIICMQGPFSVKMNEAIILETGAEYLLTKETGKAGGFYEKLDACKNTGAKVIIVGRPKEDGFSFEEVKCFIDEKFEFSKDKKIYIIGAGMGNADMLTVRANEAIKESDLIISTSRILEQLKNFKKEMVTAYKADEILKLINESRANKIAVVFSGDIGFFSGAKSLINKLQKFEVEWISGISSEVYFMNKIGKSYEKTKTISIHGRDENFIGAVRENESVLLLLGGGNTAKNACRSLENYGFRNVIVTIGENLYYPNEKIFVGIAKDFMDVDFEDLSVMLIENPCARQHYLGIADNNFIRGDVPMTKNEVRIVSIAKLRLTKNAVVYDVGAGTGSVSVECALMATYGKVFAIEKNSTAIGLIKENMKLHCASNIEIIEGNAPLVMESLPTPTHVFIGGSSGNLKEIISLVMKKNPNTRVVINAIALETISKVIEILKDFDIVGSEIIQLGVSRGKLFGNHHLMTAQNPVFIISFGMGEKYE